MSGAVLLFPTRMSQRPRQFSIVSRQECDLPNGVGASIGKPFGQDRIVDREE